MKKLLIIVIFLFTLSSCGFLNKVKYDVGGQKDVVEDINKIQREIMNSSLKIHISFDDHSSVQGSAFIYKIEEDEYYNIYYALTNAHCVTNNPHSISRIKIFDYLHEHEYLGDLVKKDIDLDIAIITFVAHPDRGLGVMSFAEKLPSKGSLVYAVGNPQGQVNTVTIGKYLGLKKLDYFEFEVIYSNVYIDHGSSGGMLLDSNLKVIGMNTVKVSNSSGNDYCGSIPFELIVSYISELD